MNRIRNAQVVGSISNRPEHTSSVMATLAWPSIRRTDLHDLGRTGHRWLRRADWSCLYAMPHLSVYCVQDHRRHGGRMGVRRDIACVCRSAPGGVGNGQEFRGVGGHDGHKHRPSLISGDLGVSPGSARSPAFRQDKLSTEPNTSLTLSRCRLNPI